MLSQDVSSSLFPSLLHLCLLLINTSDLPFLHSLLSHPLLLHQHQLLPFFSRLLHHPSSANLQTQHPRHLSHAIFRLSLSLPLPLPPLSSHHLRSYVFGTNLSHFQHFLLHFWEKSPLLIPKDPNLFDTPHPLSLSLLHYTKPNSAHSIIDSILQNSLSCPPVDSHELDINQILNQIVEASLGSPLIYNQDIRIVKTKVHSHNNEDHFPAIHKCKEAFDCGYSIALKGMQLRSDQIAQISLAFSELFGLPSVGVNLYLTPCGGQGLARHYDDHCVLVWQLNGCKSWRILKQPKPVMPRLYDSLHNTVANEKAEEIEIMLKQGDILYIPRGYFHEAHTRTNANEPQKSDCSLHLTFAMEVERPFEWEGFVHVALHCWRKKLSQTSDFFFLNSNSRFQNIRHTLLLHIAIKLVSDQTPAFWKACMVASNFKIDNQRLTFGHLINIINEQTNFMEAFNWVKFVMGQREEETIQCLRWLRNVYDDIDFDNFLETLDKYVVPCQCKTEEASAEFSLYKSRFCEGAVYEDACAGLGSLLEKYRKARRQYMKGMISLHRKY